MHCPMPLVSRYVLLLSFDCFRCTSRLTKFCMLAYFSFPTIHFLSVCCLSRIYKISALRLSWCKYLALLVLEVTGFSGAHCPLQSPMTARSHFQKSSNMSRILI